MRALERLPNIYFSLAYIASAIFLVNFEARAQSVYMISGTVVNPPNLQEGQKIVPGQYISVSMDGLVVLEYHWPSDHRILLCVSYVVISKAAYTVPSLESLAPTSDCRSSYDPQRVIARLYQGERGMFPAVTFYGYPKASVGGFEKRISDSMSQRDAFTSNLRRFAGYP